MTMHLARYADNNLRDNKRNSSLWSSFSFLVFYSLRFKDLQAFITRERERHRDFSTELIYFSKNVVFKKENSAFKKDNRIFRFCCCFFFLIEKRSPLRFLIFGIFKFFEVWTFFKNRIHNSYRKKN